MSEVGPLLDRLSIAVEALSPQNIVPLLSCFWFMGDGRVVAFNDIQGAETMTDVRLKAAVPGEQLYSLLSTFSTGASCKFTHSKESSVELKCGGSTIHLPNILFDDPPFTFPLQEPDDSFVCGEGFFDGLRHCLLSTGGEKERFQVRGVTLSRAKTGIVMYSTDNLTLSRYFVETKRVPLIKSPIMLPGKFCEQMLLAYGKEKEQPVLSLYPGGVVVNFSTTGTKLFSKLDISPSLDFEKTIALYFSDGDVKYAVKIPEDLEASLNRITIVSDKSRDRVSLWSFSTQSLVVKNRDSAGYIEEIVKCRGKVSSEFSIDTTLVQRALKSCNEMFALPGKALVLLGDDRKFLHLISFYA